MSATTKKPAAKKTTATTKPAAIAAEKATAVKPAARKAVPKKPAPVTGPQLVPALTHEQIAKRAYEIWSSRGYRHGNHVHDWWQAEQELKRA